MKKIIKGKKGSITDPIFSLAYVLKISLTILICFFVWLSFQTLMESEISGKSVESVLTPVMDTLTTAYFSVDYIFPFLVGGLLIISLVFAFKTGSNIIWGILSFLMWGIAILMATLFTNVYYLISAEFPTIYVEMPIMDIIMINMRWLCLFWVAIISAVMFRKTNAEDEMSATQGRFYGQ